MLTQQEILSLKSQWIINGIWWKWWADFWLILKELVKELPSYQEEKYLKLIDDIEYIAYNHDYEFYKWKTFFSFIKANFLFWYRIYKKLYWSWFKWVLVWVMAFLFTTIFGRKYFRQK